MIVEILNNKVIGIYTAQPKQINENATYINAPYQPAIISETQVRNGLKYENGVVTDVVQDLTPEEITEIQNQQKEQMVRAFMEKKSQDGQAYASEIRFRITKELIGKPIAEVNEATNEMLVFVYPLLNLIEGIGADWWNAMNEALKMSNPKNSICLNYFNEVKDYIVNYVQTNYPKEL